MSKGLSFYESVIGASCSPTDDPSDTFDWTVVATWVNFEVSSSTISRGLSMMLAIINEKTGEAREVMFAKAYFMPTGWLPPSEPTPDPDPLEQPNNHEKTMNALKARIGLTGRGGRKI